MIKYQSYKSSGVEWIGDIPFDWNLSKYKYKLKILSGYPFKSELFDSENGFPLLRIRDITSGSIETYYNGDFDEKYIIKRGDVVIGMDGDFNIRVWDNDDILLNQRCCKVQEYDGILLKFIYYTLPFDLKIINDLTYYTTVKHLSVDDLYNIKCVLPPIKEQHKIVQFLDEKTDLIDKLISTKERKISLLKEQRTSLINQVVTKGLNPNVKTKESGVEWIGEIPESWIISKLKYNGVFFSGYSFDSGDFISEGEIRVIKISNIQNNGISWDDLSFVPTDFYDTFKNFIVQKGDLIFVLTRPIISTGIKICFYDEDYKVLLNQRNSVYRPNSIKLNKIFTYYLVRTMYFFEEFKQQLKETNQPNISTEQISNIKIFLPPIEEQLQIVEYLDSKTKEIDDLVDLEKKKIDLLKEYRQSLISEVVTGKIKVTTDE